MAKKLTQREHLFQKSVKQEIIDIFPSCVIHKNPTGVHDGFPDLVCYLGDTWFMLECKRSKDEEHQPNQDWWVDRLNKMSYASFIFPENREEVFCQLRQKFNGYLASPEGDA